MSADIGLVGIAVMGENLVLNMESKGFKVAVFNRTTSKVDDFMNGRGKGKNLIGCHTAEDLCKNLKKPRKIMIMVRAGKPVDDTIAHLEPYLEKGDIIIDGGNSHFPDSNRRMRDLEAKGLLFVGAGVSGGEEGALKGPSIMPGGSKAAWEHIKPIFQAIAAKVEDGTPCCDWVGDEGAGHFVKMVHNGLESGDMQLINEAYYLMKNYLGMTNEEMSATFDEWNKGDLDSYLIEITRDILIKKEDDGKFVVDTILDVAGQKGTGKWTVTSALDFGMPLTMIGEAVFARCLSAQKDQRVAASKILPGSELSTPFKGDRKEFLHMLSRAVYASKLVSYTQGYVLMAAAASEFKWNLNYGGIALMWRGGCIIRSKFLGKIKEAFDKNPKLQNLLFDDYFKAIMADAQRGWRTVCSIAVLNGAPLPCITSSLAYYDGLRTERLPANLLQAQRDFFGAHTYEKIGEERGKFFHTNWTGQGGSTSSTSYVV